MKIATPPPWKKVTPSFQATPFKNMRSCQAPPFLKIWLEFQPHPPSQQKEGGAHYDGRNVTWNN